ncbi:MAG: rhomboid family intramembrane serine protease [Bacteroidales bacterium]
MLKDLPLEKRRVYLSVIFPAFFISILWIVKLIEVTENTRFSEFGVYPGTLRGLTGIFFSPLIHGDFNHLTDNSIPLFFLTWAMFYFYNKVSYRVFFITYFFPGIAVWLIGRQSYHIGSSGLIYGFGSFLFFSGIIRQNINLLAISLLVTFLYGSMVWGIFPIQHEVSWESHLSGGLAGFLLSVLYRNIGPPPTIHQWEEEEKDDDDDNPPVENDELTGDEEIDDLPQQTTGK